MSTGRGGRNWARALIVLGLSLCMAACHSGEKHAAQERMRKILEGLTGVGNVDHAVCLWGHGSTFCPGGADDYSRSATDLEAALKKKGINSFAEVKSFSIGDATYRRGDGGMFKLSAVVDVQITLNGTAYAVQCIDGEPVTFVECSDCSSAAAAPVAPATSARAAAPVRPAGPARPTPSPTPRPTLDGPQLFAAVSPSVLVVEAFDKRGKKLKQGSAVSVKPDLAITNWHVISKADSFKIVIGKERFDATLDAVLEHRDLARIRTTATLKPVPLAASIPSVGETTFALGAPHGLELTISEGILSGKRTDEAEDAEYLQTTAPISAGSSGGGLFNARGELVGITTMQVKAAQNLNFAVPVTYVADIMALPQGSVPETPVSMLAKLSAADRKWLQGFINNLVRVDKEFRYTAAHVDRARALIASLGVLEVWQKDALRFELGGGLIKAARAYWEDAIEARGFKKFVKSRNRREIERKLVKHGLMTEAEVQAGDEMMRKIGEGSDLVLEGITLVADESVLSAAMQSVAKREDLLEKLIWAP